MNKSPADFIPIEMRPTQIHALRLLQMVFELHKAGFQKIRVSPGMAPNGLHWRCTIFAPENSSQTSGVIGEQKKTESARYTSGTENLYFDWADATEDSARQLAVKFIERFPLLAEKGYGANWEYAGWFVEMLGFAERGAFPVSFADYELDPNCWASDGERKLPPPPPLTKVD